MISISSAASVGYYAGGGGGEGPGDRARSYYTDAVQHGEPPGRWSGKLAAELGLEGTVDIKDMEPLYTKFETQDGQKLGRAPIAPKSVEDRVAARLAKEPDALPERVEEIRRQVEADQRGACLAEDLTFSPPKPFTVAHTALWRGETEAASRGDDEAASAYREARLALEAALWEANQAGLAQLSDVALSRAGGGAGKAQHLVGAPDLVVASFHQHTTRPIRGADGASVDPQQHIHNVVLNKARCEDGQLRALHTKDLGRERAGVSAVADRVLAERLAALGLEIEPTKDGRSWGIKGIGDDVVDLFSARRHNITERMGPIVERMEQRYGRSLTQLELSRVASQVTLFSRASKTGTEGDFDRLLDEWQDKMRDELGRGLVPLAAQLRVTMEAGRQAGDPTTFSPEAVKAAAVQAVQEAARKSGTWNRADLMLELSLALPLMPELSAEESRELLNTLTDETLAEHAVQVSGQDHLPDLGEQTPGRGFTSPGERRYAAPVTIAGEQRIREAAIERGGHALDRDAVDQWLGEHRPTIGEDQRAAVLGLAATDAKLAVLEGPAGTGKSFATGALAGAWEALSDGGRVMGLTVSQQAAEVLKDDGVNAANIAAFLAAQERIADGRALPEDADKVIGPRDVLVIDEASMVGTDQANALRELAEATGARLIASGDVAQLGAVESGGVMELLQGKAETYTLTDVRRFEAPWEREASLGLRAGDAGALDEYDRHGRLVEYTDTQEAIAATARAAAADILAGKDTLVVAGSNDEAAAVSAAIREHLQAAGVVGEDGALLGRDGNVAGEGDRVMTRQNDYDLGVLNRGRFVVGEVLEDGGLRVADENGEERVLPAEYVQAHAQLGYASTIHAAQGMTVDRAHFMTDGRTDAAAMYVGLTRGRERNTAHVALGQRDGMEAGQVKVDESKERPSARSVLANALGREKAVPSALAALEADDARERGMENLMRRAEAVAELACRDRLECHLDDLAAEGLLSTVDRARLCAEQGTTHLAQLMRAVEQTGADPKAALREALEGRGLADAVSVSQVLSHRVQAAHDVRTAAPGQGLPEDVRPEFREHLEAIQDLAQERARELGGQVAQEAPQWAIKALGEVPADAVERLEWEARAGAIAAHREATGWTDERRPIDHAPGMLNPEARASWWGAWEALGRPESTREEAGLTDGQLQARVAAWEREQVWAPAHANAALRENELEAERARQESILEGAVGDEGRAADLAAEAEARTGVARELERVADARREWAESTAETRAAGERAREELTARGLEPGREEDRTTPEEWLEAERADRERQDERDLVDEMEVADPVREEVQEMDRDVEVPEAPAVEVLEPLEPRADERPAHQEAPATPPQVELEALAQAARDAEDRIRDRESEEAAWESWERDQDDLDRDRDREDDAVELAPVE